MSGQTPVFAPGPAKAPAASPMGMFVAPAGAKPMNAFEARRLVAERMAAAEVATKAAAAAAAAAQKPGPGIAEIARQMAQKPPGTYGGGRRKLRKTRKTKKVKKTRKGHKRH